MLYWTDMGSSFYCEYNADETQVDSYTSLDGIYMQLTMFVTHFPYGLPISMCINKECNNVENWSGISNLLASKVNKVLSDWKKQIDLDFLYSHIPVGH